MNPNTFPTKGNLILAKNSLALAVQGYGLMDKKRNILLKELTGLIGQARSIQSEIDSTFTSAYRALQKANIELGVRFVEEIADSHPHRGFHPGQGPQHHGDRDPSGGIYAQRKGKASLFLLQHQRFPGRGLPGL